MDVHTLMQNGVAYMASHVQGLAAMILDDATFNAISMCFGWSLKQLYTHEIFLVEKLSSPREAMPEVKALLCLRPTAENLKALCAELRDPKYCSYALFFTGALEPADLTMLAAADGQQLVTCVEQLHLDFQALDVNHFVLAEQPQVGPAEMQDVHLRACEKALLSILGGLGFPATIRYQATSPQCKQLAGLLADDVQQTAHADTVLLLLDRRDDMVTPCMQQWTYLAMVHELLGLELGRLNAPVLGEGVHKAPFTPLYDDFLRQNQHAIWPEVLTRQTTLQQQFKEQRALQEGLTKGSLQDIKAFLRNYERYEQTATCAQVHLGVLLELKHLFGQRSLMGDSASMLEAQMDVLVANKKRRQIWADIEQLAEKGILHPDDVLRLCTLFLLRFADDAAATVEAVWAVLLKHGVSRVQCRIAAGAKAANAKGSPGVTGDCFRLVGKPLYQQTGEAGYYAMSHSPLLAHRLAQIEKGVLSTKDFPWQGGCMGHDRPRRLVVFILGGTTLEEAKLVQNFSAAVPTMQVLLGGTELLSFASFGPMLAARAPAPGPAGR